MIAHHKHHKHWQYIWPASIYLFKANNRDDRKKVWNKFKNNNMTSSDVLIVNFEHISGLILGLFIVHFEKVNVSWDGLWWSHRKQILGEIQFRSMWVDFSMNSTAHEWLDFSGNCTKNKMHQKIFVMLNAIV